MKRILFVLCSAMVFTSCLKDKNYDNGVTGHQVGDQKVIELAVANSSVTLTSVALDFVNKDTVIAILPIKITSSAPATQDITVVIDTSVTSTYLATHPALTHFKANGGALVSPLTLVIPKGATESAPIQVRVNASNFNPSNTYLIGFRIVSVSDPSYVISANFNTHYVTFSAKNPYDGIYRVVSGFVQRYSAPGVPTVGDALNGPLGPANPDIILSTTGANSVDFVSNGISAISITWASGGGVGGIGGLRLSVDPATNLVTMSATEAPAGLTLTNWAGKVNRYDPATRTFYLAFRWNPAGSTREYEIVMTYKGPR